MKKLLLTLALVISMSAYASAALIDLRTANSGTINEAEFIFSKQQPSGSGVFNTFLRIQAAGNAGNEQGYNTDAAQLPFDTKGGIHTHSLLISSLVATGDYFEFLLDIGEPNTQSERLLSLDGLKFYRTSDKAQNGTTIVGDLLYDMDQDENKQYLDNTVLLDANREGNPGNGVSDMLLRVPASYLTPTATETYLILWSQFGLYPGAASDGTFEEWAHVGEGGSEPIPEPGTILLLGAGLAGLALYHRRQSHK